MPLFLGLPRGRLQVRGLLLRIAPDSSCSLDVMPRTLSSSLCNHMSRLHAISAMLHL
jgi:hypothetical protein